MRMRNACYKGIYIHRRKATFRFAMVLHWGTQSAYALTELVFFLITCFVLAATAAIIFTILMIHVKDKVKSTGAFFFTFVRPILQNIFETAIAFSLRRKGKSMKVVFLGYQELTRITLSWKKKVLRIWVQVYFVLLCSIVVIWFITVFSDAVLYRKTYSCLDLTIRDADMQCFLLEQENIPPGVQAIIDEEEGNAVPCDRVQNYLILTNSTFELEVICYQTFLNPLIAVGVAYGAKKAIVFAIVSLLTVFLSASRMLKIRHCSVRSICIAHIVQISISFLIIVIMVTIIAFLHGVSGSRNSSYDYLRGEPFFNTSVIALGAISILVTFGLFPWWAFEPLEKVKLSRKSNVLLRDSIHNMILHYQFSSYNDSFVEPDDDLKK